MNILDAIVRINALENLEIGEFYRGRNRINNMGDALEKFIKDAFADSFRMTEEERIVAYSQTFSFLGTQNHPPDAIIRNGDSIEIKKIESFSPSLALNSSYPKDKLRADSPMITRECRECENWQIKDIIYSIGVIPKNSLSLMALCFVYGEDYAASHEVYETLRSRMREGFRSIADIAPADTNELGRLNAVDPLGITYLRVRGQWGIQNPRRVFDYLELGNFFAIINLSKYNSFPAASRNLIENTAGIIVSDCQVRNPNNPAQLRTAKLISFRRNR